jgi:transaldolase/glucose-6-phosphate isomerase
MTNPLIELTNAGQAIWLDYLHRKILQDGELAALINDDGLRGLTSNPSIFEKAIAEADDYDEGLRELLASGRSKPVDLYEGLAIADLQKAADIFRPTFDRLGGLDGFVSLEVSPYLANDTQGTIEEAARLWKAVGRPNLMIKVPGTPEGTPAIRQLVGEGININVTLLFGRDAYQAVAEAHMAGLEAFKAKGGDVTKIHGVASFFVSRIDTAIDKSIEEKLKTATGEIAKTLEGLRGKVAIANAKLAYQDYLRMIQTPRWKELAAAGAQPQRLLWASTGAKNPAYSDVLYVETLIGPDTINTMPPKTIEAFRDHGRVSPSLAQDLDDARKVLADAEDQGLDLQGVTTELVKDGVKLFAKAFDALLASVDEKRSRLSSDRRVASR